MAMEIKVNDNGPYVIRGEDIQVFDSEGNALAYEGAAVALCRCGNSSNKPFCDGAHKSSGFESAPRASS